MRITFLGWLAILTAVAGVFLILNRLSSTPNLRSPREGTSNAEDQNLGS